MMFGKKKDGKKALNELLDLYQTIANAMRSELLETENAEDGIAIIQAVYAASSEQGLQGQSVCTMLSKPLFEELRKVHKTGSPTPWYTLRARMLQSMYDDIDTLRKELVT